MLKALYDYGVRNHLYVPPGFQKKKIKAYICLTASGKFLGIEQNGDGDEQICPDVGSFANGGDKCNPLVEKASIVLGERDKKPAFFRSVLKDGSSCAACLGACLKALEDETTFKEIREQAELHKVKDADRMSFKVDGTPITEDADVCKWWTEYRGQLIDRSGEPLKRCLITGDLAVPLKTVPVVSGLQSVGGHSRGEALFCFDKAAFQSYGLEKAENAPVSEEAFAVVKEAMNDLLAGAPAMYKRDKNRDFNPTAPIYAGMKFLHWYDFPIEPDDDLIYRNFQAGGTEDDGAEAEVAQRAEELQKRAKADAVISGVTSGEAPKKLRGQYYIMLISGNNGRAMIRRYEHGNYQNLRENLQKWNDDLSLQNYWGTGLVRPMKLYARLTRLVKRIKDNLNKPQKLSDQVKKELSGVTPAIIMAIVNGTALPDTVAVRALSYIRSQLLSSGDDDEKKTIMPDAAACQWLKVWLIRKRRTKNEEETIMAYYDPKFPNAAYHCGAWLAVYANLQQAAMGDVNATLVQRFYASASRTPALVFGTLERMGEVYLDMLRKDKKYLESIYQNRLNDVCAFFGREPGHELPKTLDLEGQSYFALGYRQMCTQINSEIKTKKAEVQEDK